ncbi:ATP-grasp domain-containing protein [Actinoalloteichus hymeniacidonis]|uniref:ATP-grasp domain n=1 Tax=Actinoalloteichus hymeniacidonis TaxID=340345 RepID=A0AAC9HPS2_9PSEU|nr:hypothetical protein [Actinoalloteichus hymeniacidonis]AOS63168.1 ATP-grasp domain [Actinoalloteichus hymeniacidonis]MBB5908795.1 glutathione synthase/RimK-type ligase-like ATP-grasp enzyme [Actinoalloteichus hymeniacidonis]
MSSPRILLVTCADLPGGYSDDAGLVRALGEAGVAAEWSRWDDPAVDFAAADLVVLRSPWDYFERLDEFLRWCDSVPRLANPASVVRWNTDKRYLTQLSSAGVAVVPSTIIAPGEPAAWPAEWAEVVVKPTVGAGSVGVGRFARERRDHAVAHLTALHNAGSAALVQPYQSSVDTVGERALVFFAGRFSHAFAKPALLDGRPARTQTDLADAEVVRPAQASADYRAVAEHALKTAAAQLGLRPAELLYARVDLIADDTGAPLLLELELSEPLLGFGRTEPSAIQRFVDAVQTRLRAN